MKKPVKHINWSVEMENHLLFLNKALTTRQDIADVFNRKFNTSLTKNAIIGKLWRMGVGQAK